MAPILQVGPLALQLPGLLILVGLWLAYLLVEREAKRVGASERVISNMLLFALIAGIVGARLGHALRYLDLYLGDPAAFVALSPVTLSIPEGMLAASLVALVYGNRKQLRFWATMDVLTPGMALFMVFLGLAHISSGDAFGSPTTMPWGIDLWGAKRHPSQFYETISALIVFLIIMLARTRSSYPGFLFLLFLGFTAASRVILEAWRGDSVIILGMFRQPQVVGLGALVLVLVAMHFLSRGSAPREEIIESRVRS